MSRRKPAEVRLAQLVQEMGFEKAEATFNVIKALHPVAPRSPVVRRVKVTAKGVALPEQAKEVGSGS